LTPLLFGLFSYALTGSMALSLILAMFGAVLPVTVLRFQAGRRMRAFEAQLPDALQLLAGTLRAGFSITQAVTSVADDLEEPIGKELRRSVAEMQLGRSLEDSLDGVAERLDSTDFRWAVLAIRIQREVGGNLAELLATVAETMIQRQRLLRDVRAMTAEGRMSAMVLGALPLGMIGFLAVSNPGYLRPLTYGVGLIIALASAVMMLGGFIWMNKIIKIEV
jgi:tight adherence protein B